MTLRPSSAVSSAASGSLRSLTMAKTLQEPRACSNTTPRTPAGARRGAPQRGDLLEGDALLGERRRDRPFLAQRQQVEAQPVVGLVARKPEPDVSRVVPRGLPDCPRCGTKLVVKTARKGKMLHTASWIARLFRMSFRKGPPWANRGPTVWRVRSRDTVK